ncbi:hypothetical protein LBMAG56_24270 [Verrucomicrobiota bacterium]|nr:hypothetical protein LBMAG56_24270 [Verrucomicrobiota bacterium]
MNTHVDTPQSRCRFGLATGDITPPANIYHRMWGAAKHERATGIHRPLRATVIAFAADSEAGDARADTEQILVALDHCVLGAVELTNLLDHVSAATGFRRETIAVVFSHTHASGLMGLDRVGLPGGDLIPDYLNQLGRIVSELTSQAQAGQTRASIVYGTGRCRLAGHRDFWDETTQQTICGFNPTGPADDTVLVARVTNEHGATLATFVNYACHPTTLAWDNTLISPDFPGAMREVVEQATGAPCVFLQGASGELGPREGYVGDPAVADRNGRELGYAALSALTALPAAGTRFVFTGAVVSGATLGAWAHQPLTPAELAASSRWQLARWNEALAYRPGQPKKEAVATELQQFQHDERAARADGDLTRAAESRAMAERKMRLLHRLAQLPPGEHFPLQVVLWRMGDAFWLVAQGEMYSVFQTELRRRFPNTPIIVATIAADWGASYLPPAGLYDKKIYQESIAVVAPGSLEQLMDSIATRIKSL